jgi:hypothetical protein
VVRCSAADSVKAPNEAAGFPAVVSRISASPQPTACMERSCSAGLKALRTMSGLKRGRGLMSTRGWRRRLNCPEVTDRAVVVQAAAGSGPVAHPNETPGKRHFQGSEADFNKSSAWNGVGTNAAIGRHSRPEEGTHVGPGSVGRVASGSHSRRSAGRFDCWTVTTRQVNPWAQPLPCGRTAVDQGLRVGLRVRATPWPREVPRSYRLRSGGRRTEVTSNPASRAGVTWTNRRLDCCLHAERALSPGPAPFTREEHSRPECSVHTRQRCRSPCIGVP